MNVKKEFCLTKYQIPGVEVATGLRQVSSCPAPCVEHFGTYRKLDLEKRLCACISEVGAYAHNRKTFAQYDKLGALNPTNDVITLDAGSHWILCFMGIVFQD